MRSQQNSTLLLIEVAQEIKLLAWREAEQFPSQLEELRGLLPLRDVEGGQEAERSLRQIQEGLIPLLDEDEGGQEEGQHPHQLEGPYYQASLPKTKENGQEVRLSAPAATKGCGKDVELSDRSGLDSNTREITL